MKKDKIKKYIKIFVIIILSIIFINKCLLTNEADSIFGIDEEKLIGAYIFEENPTTKRSSWVWSKPPPEVLNDPELLYHWDHYYPHNFNLRDGLIIWFNYDFYGHYFNTNYQTMHGRLYMDGLYKYIYIKEINIIYDKGNKNLMKNKKIEINQKVYELVDENGNPIVLDNKKYYYSNIDLEKLNHHFINGFLGEKKEIQLELIYSFDNQPLRTEKYKYEVKCGGKRIDFSRLFIWVFPP